jgi:hypothetical protein
MVTGKETVYTTTVEQEYIDELLVHNIIYEDTLPKSLDLPEGLSGLTHTLTI